MALLLLASATQAFSQNKQTQEGDGDPCMIHEQKTHAWRLTPTLGSMYRVPLDTLFQNYHQTDMADTYAISYNYLGNFGLPGESRVHFQRDDRREFIFASAYEPFNTTPDKQTYYNTQIPYTQLSYLTGGSKQNAEDRLKATFAGNINKKIGLGASLDYIYTRGFYNWQSVNSLSWQGWGSYISKQYQVHAYANTANFSNQENGGISDTDYILKPETINENLSDPKNIPTNLEEAWNRVKHKDYYLTQRYSLGFDRSLYSAEGDTLEMTEFIPVTSFVHTLHMERNARRFRINPGGIKTDGFFNDHYIYSNGTNDTLSYWALKNTLAITLNEGFNKYAKFGLAGYVTLENRKYTNMVDSLDLGFIARTHKSTTLWVGGEISKQKGSILTYWADTRFGLSGDNLGDLHINGALQTKIPIRNDSLMVRASGFFKNMEPSYYTRHLFTNHFRWNNNFSKEKRFRIQGDLIATRLGANLQVGVENITNYVYFNDEGVATQHADNVQVFSAILFQNFKVGVLNWNNSLAYQKSSNQEVMPLPDFSAYSQLFLKFSIARSLHTEVGFDCSYFTKYYAPVYQPATQMFQTQSREQVGNYPLVNVFANLKLKKVRFFVMMYHVNKGLFGGNNYFSAPNYPLNPMVFKYGVSLDFNN